MQASFVHVCVALVAASVVGSLSAEQGSARPLAKIRQAVGQTTPGGLKTPMPTAGHPATVGGLAQALPDLIINNGFVTGTVVKEGIKFKVPMMIRVRNQGAAKAGAFTVGVYYAQPTGVANPPLSSYTGKPIFLTAANHQVVVLELAAGQEAWVSGYAYLPQNLAGESLKIRGFADTGGSLEHAQPGGSVKETSETNNWSAAISVNVPNG